MQIFVGSTNPVKINAVVTAASETWPEVVVKGCDIPSGIPDQPWGDAETKQGAINRAKAALKFGQSQTAELPDQILGVGLEGGVFEYGHELWSTVWVAVVDSKDQIATANGARFQVPERIAQLIRAGEEMGPVVEKLVGKADVRKKQGMIGVITNNFVDRTEEYSGISKMALGLWYGRDWDANLGDK